MNNDDSPVHADHRIQREFPQNVRFCALCGGAMRMRTVKPDYKRFKVCDRCGFVHFPSPKLVAGCLVIERGRVLLEHQYRHAAQSMMWELPAGRIDDGERELAAAKRELLEETGYTARSWRKILHFYVSPGFLDETMTIYLARELKAGRAQPEADEKIEVHFFSLAATQQMVLTGRIRDAKTIAGILWLARKSSMKA